MTIDLDLPVADDLPWQDMLTPYDEARLCLYLRLLDAEAEGADWREVARLVLHRDPAAEPERSHHCWRTHLRRAQWVAKNCYDRLQD